MAYYKTTIKAGETIEVTKSFTKKTGPKARSKRAKPTPEEIIEINRLNAIRLLTLKLNANYKADDIWLTNTYRRDERPSVEDAKKKNKKFIDDLRIEFKKLKVELKYVSSTEYKNKAIHHHLVINQPEGVNVMKIIRRLWQYGRPSFKLLDDSGQYRDLAAYIIKETEKTFRENDGGHKQRYSCSRNLIIPQPKTKVVKATRWSPDPQPMKEYYIDQDTIYNGTDKCTGRLFQRYMMVKLKPKGRGGRYAKRSDQENRR